MITSENLQILIDGLRDYKSKGVIDPWVLGDGTTIEPLEVLEELALLRRAHPMGVSQWADYGKRYTYWDFFEKEVRKEVLTKLLNTASGGGSWRRIAIQLMEEHE